ncbi:MAG TPA: hypothetical protein VGR22_03240 [Thermomicrobiales bacterium]|nr:hypothetical protein [Thermomicrobiales bacterium]
MSSENDHPRATAAFFDDGLWDIALGLGILTFALGSVIDAAYLPILAIPVLAVITWIGKRRIAALRPSPPVMPKRVESHRTSLWTGGGTVVVLGYLIPILSMAGHNGDSLIWDIRRIPVGLALAAGVAIIGPLSWWWYLYAGVIASVTMIAWLLEWPAWAEFGVSGNAILAAGAFILRRFATSGETADTTSPRNPHAPEPRPATNQEEFP